MDYGIGIPFYIDAWREVRAAEEAGFTHAWIYDSQLILNLTVSKLASMTSIASPVISCTKWDLL